MTNDVNIHFTFTIAAAEQRSKLKNFRFEMPSITLFPQVGDHVDLDDTGELMVHPVVERRFKFTPGKLHVQIMLDVGIPQPKT